MEPFWQLFHHATEYRILICQSCAFAVPPTQLGTHLAQQHPAVSVARRRDMVAHVATLGGLGWTPNEICLPELAETPIDQLAAPMDGWCCTSPDCHHVCSTIRGMQHHCKTAHGWENCQRRGGDARKKTKHAENRLWRPGTYQPVFRAVGWPRYLAVQHARYPTAEGLSDVVRAERQRQRDRQTAVTSQDTIQGGHRVQVDGWLEATDWVAHLAGYSRAALLQAREVAQEPCKPEDRALQFACRAMHHVIRKAFSHCRPEHAGRATLEIIERRETGASTNEKPFYAGHQPKTIQKYSDSVQRVLCYLWRTYEQAERPCYQLTSTQGALLRSLQARARDRRQQEEMERNCVQLWIALLDHQLMGNEHESGLLSGIAVLGLRPDSHGGGWQPAHLFSSTLSALITTSKALVVYEACCQQNQAGYPAAPAVYEIVQDMSQRFMTLTDFGGQPTPMNRMLRQRTFARSQAKTRNAPGRVAWDRDRILVDNQTFTLAQLRALVKGLYERVRVQLMQDVLLLPVDDKGEVRSNGPQLPPLSMDALVDEPANQTLGWSFLKHPSNRLETWETWLFERLMDEPALRQRFIQGIDHTQQPPKTQWRDDAVAAYMKGVRRFKEGLFALVHLTAGAPARGTEITSIQRINNEDGVGYRGVFVDHGLLSFVTAYHKGYSFSKRVKVVHRYVPREVGELVVYFLGLGQPFIDDVQMMCNQVDRPTAFIWEPEPETAWSDDDSDCDASDGSKDDADPAPRARSANPDGYWGTDRRRRVLREQTMRHGGIGLGIQTWRHTYPAIHRELVKDSQAARWLDTVYYGKEPDLDNARALQSGHTRETAECNYGRLSSESPFQTTAERNAFRRVSQDWHRILEFASAWEEGNLPAGMAAEKRAQHQQEAQQRWLSLATADHKAAFRQLVGRPDAEYRGVQEEALHAILQRKLRVLAIMGTGAGKSLLFMLPMALSPSSITIVVAPFNALRDDLKGRCNELGLSCAKWDGQRPPYWASIVLVTPESAVTKSFGRFLDEQRMLQKLDRIVIDECHVLLESSKSWRPNVLKLVEMTEKGTQLVYMTATLPPTLQPAFLQLAGLTTDTVTICRAASTARSNIAYQVLEYPRDELDQTLTHLVATKRAHHGPDAQILVFCSSVAETNRLAMVLQCTAYHREMDTDEEKARMVRKFTSGQEKLCTATNMMGLGLNAPGVRVVIHVAMRSQLLQYLQESGRAGRTGLPSEAIVMRSYWMTKKGTMGKATGYTLEPSAAVFLDTHQCRRIAIDQHMDGRLDRRRCEPGESPCDVCAQQPRGQKRSANDDNTDTSKDNASTAAQQEQLAYQMRREEQQVQQAQRRKTDEVGYELERLDKYLRRWTQVCPLCMAIKGEAATHHWKNCHQATREQQEAMETVTTYLCSVKWEPYARCNYCSAPQALCNKWEETDKQGHFRNRGQQAHCQFKGVLLGAIAALISVDANCALWLKQQVQKAAIVQGGFDKQLAVWLGRKTKMGLRDVSFMCYFLYAWEEGYIVSSDLHAG